MRRSLLFLMALIALAGCVAEGAAPLVVQAPQLSDAQHADAQLAPEPARVIEPVPAESSISLPSDAPAACPITPAPQPPFAPPSPYPATLSTGEFWYGSNSLWTALLPNGTWGQLPLNEEGYSQKIFWWKEGYDWHADPQPDLSVRGRRLDAEAPEVIASQATNGFHEELQSFMLVGVEIPTPGCWEFSGSIDGNELSFVVWVAP